MKATLLCVLLCLLWSLVEVQSQSEYPYVSFKGNRLLDHSYVNFDEVGRTGTGPDNNTVQCRTDLITCCATEQASPRGDWFFPDGTRLPIFSQPGNIKESLQLQVVHIRRLNNAIGPSGIYRCLVGTNATHDDNDPSVGEAVYVGLYHNGGGTYYVGCEDNYPSAHAQQGLRYLVVCVCVCVWGGGGGGGHLYIPTCSCLYLYTHSHEYAMCTTICIHVVV